MLKLFLFVASMLTPEPPVFRELAVGDVIELKAPRVLASAQSPAPAPVVVVVPVPVAPAGDPYGFNLWLNAVRARHGLHALAYDPGLASIAAANSSRGFGHHRLHGGRENVGMGSLGQVESGWMNSPAHAAAILDRGIRAYGIAFVNGVWTYVAH
jgi:hypothetical protein